jgi:hypothetical protein
LEAQILVEMPAIGHDLEPNTTNCTDPTEVRHEIGEDDDPRLFSLFAIRSVPLLDDLAKVNQPKVLVIIEGDRVLVHTNICGNRMYRKLGGGGELYDISFKDV